MLEGEGDTALQKSSVPFVRWFCRQNPHYPCICMYWATDKALLLIDGKETMSIVCAQDNEQMSFKMYFPLFVGASRRSWYLCRIEIIGIYVYVYLLCIHCVYIYYICVYILLLCIYTYKLVVNVRVTYICALSRVHLCLDNSTPQGCGPQLSKKGAC